MKLIKKTIVIILAVISALLCACTGQQQITYTIFGGSFWLKSTDADVSAVDETCVYDVTYQTEEDSAFTVSYDEGTELKTHLFTQTIDGKMYYTFTTELTLKGSYKFGEKPIPINDKVVSECIFLGIPDQFKPLRSSKSVTSITASSSDNTPSFSYFSYKQTTEYSDNKAVVKVTKGDPIPEELIKSGVKEQTATESESTYDKLKKPYIDNELTLFFPRAAKLTPGFNATYTSLDVLAKKTHSMKIIVNEEKGTSEVKLPSYSLNGAPAKEKTIACNNAIITINEDFSGSSITLCYAMSGDTNENYRRLIKMEVPMSYRGGKMTYLLKQVLYN